MMHQPIDRYASPETLAKVTAAPVAVCELIFLVTQGDRAHIALLRDGRGDSVTWEERYAIIWVARVLTACSFPQIGRAMASDHSSIIRGYRRANMLRQTSEEFRAMTNRLILSLPRSQRVGKSASRRGNRIRGG